MSRAEELLKQINKRIESLDVGDTPGNLYDPIYYIMKLGGKARQTADHLKTAGRFCHAKQWAPQAYARAEQLRRMPTGLL